MHLLAIIHELILDTQPNQRSKKKICKRLTKTTIAKQKKIIDYLLSGCRNSEFYEYCGLPYTILNTREQNKTSTRLLLLLVFFSGG